MLYFSSVSTSVAAEDTRAPYRLLLMGDSIMAGYGLPAEEAFPHILQKNLQQRGWPITIIDASVSGDTSAGGLARLAWVLEEKPDILLLGLGANDGLRGIPPATSFSNLQQIIEQTQRRGIKIMLLGMKAPTNMGTEYVNAVTAGFNALAQQYQLPFYPFLLEGVALQPLLNQADGIHPNKLGTEKIMEKLVPAIEKFAPALHLKKQP
ncbi:MAG: arylesterase [Alphaproteobacteria bacterium]